MNKTTVVENQTKDSAVPSKPSKRIREDKPRKKDEKSLEHVFRALDSLGTTEHKLGAMCQKYAEMYNDHRMLQAAIKQAEKKNTVLQKEKEQLQSEHSKAILTRSRLENLCRELQRQNKAVKEECMLKMREEGEKKREVAAKFHSMLSEIGSLLAQNNNKNAKLRDDNLDMSMRLKSVCDQFEKKEQHVENLAKQMELEMQLADAKLAKAKMEMDIEKETLEKEKQQLVIELAEYKRKLVEMKASELTLREQITMYSDKYEEFHNALIQSNSAIGEFKAEMERMTKHIRRLEKETATWMSRYDAAQRTLAEVSQGKLRSDEALALSQRRLIALQGICRGLQEQCRQLRGEQRRDSQTEEEFKKIEEQIKEVERSADIDSRPCSRKASTEMVTENSSSEECHSTQNPRSAAGDDSPLNSENKSIVAGTETNKTSENTNCPLNSENKGIVAVTETNKTSENTMSTTEVPKDIVNEIRIYSENQNVKFVGSDNNMGPASISRCFEINQNSASSELGINVNSNENVVNETNNSEPCCLSLSESHIKVQNEASANHVQEDFSLEGNINHDILNGVERTMEETEELVNVTETNVPITNELINEIPNTQSSVIENGNSDLNHTEKSTDSNGGIATDNSSYYLITDSTGELSYSQNKNKKKRKSKK